MAETENQSEASTTPPPYVCPESPPERIELGALTLRRWRDADHDPLFALTAASQQHLQPFMPWAAQVLPEHTTGYLARCEEGWVSGTSFGYAMVLTDDDTIVGSTGLMGRIGPHALEIGYWVAVDHLRRGYATLTTAAQTEVALAIDDVHAVEVHHDVANLTSRRVPDRLGYVLSEERAVPAQAPAETGTHAIWVATRETWPGSYGHGLVAGFIPGRTPR